MNYESFSPIDKSSIKGKKTLLHRIKVKLNNDTDSEDPIRDDSPKSKSKSPERKVLNENVKKQLITEKCQNTEKMKSPIENYQEFSKGKVIAKRNSAAYIQDKMTITRLIKSVTTNLTTTIRQSADNLSVPIPKIDRGCWMPDSICRKCYNCEDEFTAIKRKHHCRMCGQIFCYYCCTFELPGSLWNLTKPQRSCQLCFLAYYSHNGSKMISPRTSQLNYNTSIKKRNSKYNLSPRGSITSEKSFTSEHKLSSSNKNLSFSSNDIHYICENLSEPLFNNLDVPDTESQSEHGDDFDALNEVKRNNIAEIEELSYEQNSKKARKLSLHQAYNKYFFPSHILSKEKLFGTKSIAHSSSSNILSSLETSSDQTNHKRTLLSIWKLIIHETEKNRRCHFMKTRLQTQTRKLEQRFSFPNDEEENFKNVLQITLTGTNMSKSCTHGHVLIDWIISATEVNDRFRAIAICQSYLEMQLLFPFFEQDDRRTFKDDNTLYVIREFLSDNSSRTDASGIPNTETDFVSMLGSSSNQKSSGNSTFYVVKTENDSLSNVHYDPESLIKSPQVIRPVIAGDEFDSDLGDSINQKINTNLWNRNCKYLEKLLKQELHDYNLDISWCNVILPICNLICEKICPNTNNNKLINDIRNFIQIKKIANSSSNDCKVAYSVSMSKNIDFPMKKEVRNPNVILIRSSIDYWRHKKLVSLEPLLLQEKEYLKNCVIKIKTLGPDIVVVEGSVSLLAKDMMEKCGLVLISNVRKEQIERLARMLDTTIYDSVDSLGANVESLIGKCSQFSVQDYTLTNGKHKRLLFFKLCNPNHGCTLLLHGKSLSELVRVKYVIKFIIIAFKNAYLELACLMNFQIKPYPTNLPSSTDRTSCHPDDINESSSIFLDIVENRCIAMSVNVHYNTPAGILRGIFNPELQSRLLHSDIINMSFKDRINDVLKRKQRHICAELYDVARMNVRKHPLMHEPQLHAFINSFHNKELDNKERCILYSDFRSNGSRFHAVNKNLENSFTSTSNFDSSDLSSQVGFLTKFQEIKWRNFEKKNFDSINDSFNPRNYQRILLLYSIQTRSGICEKPRKISLNYYANTDRTLGNFVSSMLNDVTSCPAKCDLSIFDHVYKFVSSGGCIQVSLHQLENDSQTKLLKSLNTDSNSASLRLWNWCSRCDKLLPLQTMSDETWHLSLGRFFDILFNLNRSDVVLCPGQCSHSLQTDIHYYFTQASRSNALEIKYVPISVYEFQTPDIFINIKPSLRSSTELFEIFKSLQSEISIVTGIKTKYNLEIKEQLCKLKSISKEKDNELCDFLQKDSNSEQYSQTMQDIYNLMEEICSPSTEFLKEDLFVKHENYIKDEIAYLWIDVVTMVTKWDTKLSEAFEREEKLDKKTIKTDGKNNKNYNDNSQTDTQNNTISIYPIIKLEKNQSVNDIKEISNKSNITSPDFDSKSDIIWKSFESENYQKKDYMISEISPQLCPISRTSTENSFDNIDEIDLSFRKEKSNTFRENDMKLMNQVERTSATNTMQPLRKLFPGFFNSNGFKILADPSSQSVSYSFLNIECIKVPVVVTDDFISSSVSFVLSSDVYLEMLNEAINLSKHKESEKFEIIPRLTVSQISKISTELANLETFVISDSNPIIGNEKQRKVKFESISKDRELSVRYFPHAELEDLSCINYQEILSNESKHESDDIKIELSSEDNLEDTGSQKSITSNKPISKSTLNNEFIINLNNYKVKCVVKIYYPKQFHELRQMIFKNEDLNYIRSLSECKCWATSGGKSGLIFRKTLDNRFIIKQLHVIELEGFIKFHAKYFDYISERIENKEKCVLAKILGVYHVDYYNSLTKVSQKMDFLVMENVFYNQKPSRIFDLKGNKQGAANMTTEKLNDNLVMRDKDFINYSRTNPLYVSWQAQIALKETLTRDTDFLQSLPVMDYSLLVGVDEDNVILVIGIIDYLRMFTMNKLIEMHFKQKLLTPHGELPTVIQPQKYQKRFLEAMEEYFLVCPIPWDHLLLYPSKLAANSNSKNKQNFSFNFMSIFNNIIPKVSSLPKNRNEIFSDRNQLRSGLINNV